MTHRFFAIIIRFNYRTFNLLSKTATSNFVTWLWLNFTISQTFDLTDWLYFLIEAGPYIVVRIIKTHTRIRAYFFGLHCLVNMGVGGDDIVSGIGQLDTFFLIFIVDGFLIFGNGFQGLHFKLVES
jgi:hypothetical protein